MSTSSNLYKKLLGVGLGSALAISGAFLVSPSEGLVTKTYLDPVNIVTSCRGHVGPELKLGQTFTVDQCDEVFAKDLIKHDKQLMSVVKVPFKSDYQHAAMLSFVYNVGIGNFSSSTMLKRLNARNYGGACLELTRWIYAKGKKLNGLVTRRTKEYQYCMGEVPLEVKDLVNESNQ
jgi:lysozyme